MCALICTCVPIHMCVPRHVWEYGMYLLTIRMKWRKSVGWRNHLLANVILILLPYSSSPSHSRLESMSGCLLSWRHGSVCALEGRLIFLSMTLVHDHSPSHGYWFLLLCLWIHSLLFLWQGWAQPVFLHPCGTEPLRVQQVPEWTGSTRAKISGMGMLVAWRCLIFQPPLCATL